MQVLSSKKGIAILLLVVAVALVANLVVYWVAPAVKAAVGRTNYLNATRSIGVSTQDAKIVPLAQGGVGGLFAERKSKAAGGAATGGRWAIYGVIANSDTSDVPTTDQPDPFALTTTNYGQSNCVAIGYIEFDDDGQVYHMISRHAWEVANVQAPTAAAVTSTTP